MSKQPLFQDSVIYLIGLAIVAVFWFDQLIAPNSFTFAFGGDALFLYYNTTFHSCFGDGVMLQNMNYPHGESIFMTDAQGALAILLSLLQKMGINTCDYGVGIVNGLILYLLPLTLVFVHKILRFIGLPFWWSLLSGIGIAFLSPQILRMIAHFGLSYPFLIPMGIYWILRKMKIMRWEKRDLIYLLVSAFFFFNNPYIGFACFLFVPLTMMIHMWLDKGNRIRFSYSFVGITMLISIAILAYLKLFDPFDYRVSEQWGFFHYSANLEGMLAPQFSFLHYIIDIFGSTKDISFEKRINLGLIPVLCLLTGLVVWIIRKVKKANIDLGKSIGSNYKPLVYAALLISIVAFNKNIPLFPERILSEYFPSLLFFKATARFAWLLYYVVAIWASYFVYQIIQKYAITRTSKYIIFGFIAAIWMLEAFHLLQVQSKLNHRVSPFKESKALTAQLEELNINKDEFQAMLTLPIKQGWASKFIQEQYWTSQFYGAQISMATRLPMVDGRLSRMDVSHAMKILQLEASPLLDKKRLYDVLPNKKDILLIRTHDGPIPAIDQYWIDLAEPIAQMEKYDLYRLPVSTLINSSEKLSAQQILKTNSKLDEAIHYLHFDDNVSEKSFVGDGASEVPVSKEFTNWQSLKLPAQVSDQIEISFWMYVDNKKYGMPDYEFQLIENSEVIQSNIIQAGRMRNIDDYWLRITNNMSVKANQEIRINYKSNSALVLDELMVKSAQDTVIYKKDGIEVYNNFNIK